ncbi:hypothetical protein [Jatrophihabitans endophyticus]|uniref:hypothetical protein n=1 Tax=Jatrophihabitans endophyticus TaxID=1206085 RepID=UPI0019E5DA0F|nr:hypothetical protein [Jatrophihabitans endophyticus]MBE7189287.1 hypothetical protein [Jatrophihabitans endophyticus]
MITFLTDRVSRLRDEGERGFALIFVLFVTTVVMIGTATTLAVASGGISPSRQNQDNAAALSAAQAGVQRMLSMLDANCPSGSISRCSAIATASTTPLTGVIGTEKYTVSTVNPGSGSAGAGYLSASNHGTLIVKSTGVSPVTASGTAANGAVTRTVTAAVSATPNPLSLAYFSNYETVGSTFLNNYYGPRKIALADLPGDQVLSAIGVSAASATVSWNGAALSSPNGLGDNICDKLWYDAASNVNDGDTATSGRATLKSTRSALPSGADYAETGTLQPLGGAKVSETRYAPCETTFSAVTNSGESFNGPVYSRDAFYLSNGTTGGAGPLFSVPTKESLPALWTGWTTNNTPAAPSSNAYRSFPTVLGAPATGSGTVSSSPFGNTLALPAGTGITAGTCTFTGPTKVALSGGNAVVTSPLTSNPGASCPATVTGAGYTVPVTTTTIDVRNSSSSTSLGFLGLSSSDITSYSRSAGDAYVSGTLTSGKLSLVTDDDIIVTGNVLASHSVAGDGKQPTTTDPVDGESDWSTGSAAIDLVATNDVRVYHPVACADQLAADLTPTTAGWCPNDMTGLYQTNQSNLVVDSSGTLLAAHPSKQYTNIAAGNEPSEIDAAIFALNGSFYADNFDRGAALGPLLVSGGVYQNHHGPLGEQWENPTGSTARAYSGFSLRINYLNYSNAGLGYVPELSGGSALHPWQLVSVATGGPS